MSAIVTGDLVIIVHAHCDAAAPAIGIIKLVKAVAQMISAPCAYCGLIVGPCAAMFWGEGMIYPLPWVRKIEPLAELDRWHDVLEVSK